MPNDCVSILSCIFVLCSYTCFIKVQHPPIKSLKKAPKIILKINTVSNRSNSNRMWSKPIEWIYIVLFILLRLPIDSYRQSISNLSIGYRLIRQSKSLIGYVWLFLNRWKYFRNYYQYGAAWWKLMDHSFIKYVYTRKFAVFIPFLSLYASIRFLNYSSPSSMYASLSSYSWGKNSCFSCQINSSICYPFELINFIILY